MINVKRYMKGKIVAFLATYLLHELIKICMLFSGFDTLVVLIFNKIIYLDPYFYNSSPYIQL